MGLIRKILFVAIVGIGSWNADALLPPAAPVTGTNILDFDTIANINQQISASLQPKIYQPAGYQAADPDNNLRYVYFTVFNPGDVEDNHFIHAVVRNPNVNDHNIYFPEDGHQPTTEEAARWSCANVDAYNANSNVTNWYVKMFGGPDAGVNIANGVNVVPRSIKTGYAPILPLPRIPGHQGSCPIISFDISMRHSSVLQPVIPPVSSTTNDFWIVFRKIAANPVGRVLLYRILIEIRRKDTISSMKELPACFLIRILLVEITTDLSKSL